MIKVSLVVTVGLAATVLLRTRPAALRHWVLAAALGCAALTPVFELIVPAWRLPAASWVGQRVEPLALVVPIAMRPWPEGPPRVVPGAARVRPDILLRSFTPVWIGGSIVSLFLLFAGLARLTRLASRASRVPTGAWTETTAMLSRRMGVRVPVSLLESDRPDLLATWGMRRPILILPNAARAWSDERLRVVLGHELAHIRRRDWFVQMLAEVLRCIYWFNPLFWIACRRLRQESEHACDDAVLDLGIDGSNYAAHLLDLARTTHRRTAFPVPAMARPSNLERRVRAMLNDRLDRAPIRRWPCIAAVVALLGLTIPIAGVVASTQAGGATFAGTMADALGRGMPGVPIDLTNVATGQRHEGRSDDTGHFSFSRLAAGEYQVEVRQPGFATLRTKLTLAAGQQLQQDVAMQIGSVSETITVTARPSGAPSAAPVRQTRPAPSTADACSQSPAGGCLTPPIKLTDVRPQYPQRHADAGISGTVEFDGRIGTDGSLKELRLLSPGDPDFGAAALEAIRQWRFAPTRLGGVPVDTNIHITVRFSARQ